MLYFFLNQCFSIKCIGKIFINVSLVHIVKIQFVVMEVSGEFYAYKTPMPWLIDIIAVTFWIRKLKAETISVSQKPLVSLGVVKTVNLVPPSPGVMKSSVVPSWCSE